MAKKILKYVVLAVVVGNLALIAVVFLGGKSPSSDPLPNPNGYDDFVRAGQILTGNPADYNTIGTQQLADFVSKNKQALQLVRLGLSRECRVPNAYTTNFMKGFVRDVTPFRELAYSLCAEGKLAETDNRTNDAARSYLDAMRFGEMSSKAGFIASKSIGIACEYEPCQRLKSLVPSLNAQQCREVAQNLEMLNSAEDPVERNLREEKTWLRKEGLRGQVEAILEFKSLRETREDFKKRFQSNRLQRIQLTITFAGRAYELDKGRKPQNLAELVPAHLKAIPVDPFTGTNIVYAP